MNLRILLGATLCMLSMQPSRAQNSRPSDVCRRVFLVHRSAL